MGRRLSRPRDRQGVQPMCSRGMQHVCSRFRNKHTTAHGETCYHCQLLSTSPNDLLSRNHKSKTEKNTENKLPEKKCVSWRKRSVGRTTTEIRRIWSDTSITTPSIKPCSDATWCHAINNLGLSVSTGSSLSHLNFAHYFSKYLGVVFMSPVDPLLCMKYLFSYC